MGNPDSAGGRMIFKTNRRDKISGERELPLPQAAAPQSGSRREGDTSTASWHCPRVGSPFPGGSITTWGLSVPPSCRSTAK